MGQRSYMPGQHINGRIYTHDHFPDKRVSEERIREVAETLRRYNQALRDETSEKFKKSGFIRRGLIGGGLALFALLSLCAPYTTGHGRYDLYAATAFQTIFGWSAGITTIAAFGIFSTFYSGYWKKLDEIKKAKAYWEHDKTIQNYELVHVLHQEHRLEPMYTPSNLVMLDQTIPTADGKTTTVGAIAPSFIPRFYTHKLPQNIRVRSRDGKRVLNPRGDSEQARIDRAEWPQVEVKATFWKFRFEGDFKLAIGERNMDDGRWTDRPEIMSMTPAGLFTSKINFGGTGTGKSQAGLLPDIYQVLAWNADIPNEKLSIDKLRAFAQEYAATLAEDPEQTGLAVSLNNPYLALSEEAYDKLQESGGDYAWEKIAMFVVEPKGELIQDITEIAEKVGRPNDVFELGTADSTIAKWQERRQALRASAFNLYRCFGGDTTKELLRFSLQNHLDDFWKSEIIRRAGSGEWEPLGFTWSKNPAHQVALQLSDFDVENSDRVRLEAGALAYGERGLTGLREILEQLRQGTAEATTRLFPVSGFGNLDPSTENPFLGFVFEKANVLSRLGNGGLPVFNQHLSQPYRAAFLEALTLLASAVGDLRTDGAAAGDLGQGDSCDGLLTGITQGGIMRGVFPVLRPISLLALTPPAPKGGPDAPADLQTLVASDLAAAPPVEQDELKVRNILRFCSPPIRRPGGEGYDDWNFRRRVSQAYHYERWEQFQEQAQRVFTALASIPGAGPEVLEAYNRIHQVLHPDLPQALDDLVGDQAFESSKERLSSWQTHLRGMGYSPVAERAKGQYDSDLRVGLLPIDAVWNTGCWDGLYSLIKPLCLALANEWTRKALAESGQVTSVSGDLATGFSLSAAEALDLVDTYIRAAHQYYAIETPAVMGHAVRRVAGDPETVLAAAEKALQQEVKRGAKSGERFRGMAQRFERYGHLSSDFIRALGDPWLFDTVTTCTGTNKYNPIYNPAANSQAIASELGAALSAGEKTGETFWKEGYTSMSAEFHAICMAADGWVTVADILTCFMKPAFYERKLMRAEQRLARLKRLQREMSMGAMRDDGINPWVKVYQAQTGGTGLPFCLVAEREWALAQAREMSGLSLSAPAVRGGRARHWLGDSMDSPLGTLGARGIRPVVRPLQLREFQDLHPSGDLQRALEEAGFSGAGPYMFESSTSLLRVLRTSGCQVPGPEVSGGVVEVVAGLYAREIQERIAGDDRLGISKFLVERFLSGKMAYGITDGWKVQGVELGAAMRQVPCFAVVPPITPPPILAQEIQWLENTITSFKNYIVTTLQGEALGDARTKGNLLISFQVKVEALRKDAAVYSFAPGSRFDITFPTFDKMRTDGLIIVSRITDSVYMGVDQLISRLAIQQFQRTIRSRMGRHKALLKGVNGEPPLIKRANQLASRGLKKVGARLILSISPADYAEALGLRDRNAQGSGEGQGPKERLKAYLKACKGQEFAGFPSPLEAEKFGLFGTRLQRNVESLPGLLEGGELTREATQRIGFELLAMAGKVHESRLGGDSSGQAVDISDGSWRFGAQRWTESDDLVLRGLAVYAHTEEVERLFKAATRGRLGGAVLKWLQGMYHGNLSQVKSEEDYAKLSRTTMEQQALRLDAVAMVQDRRDLLANVAVVMDEPDLRRLVAFVNDEVQQYVIPPTATSPGDGGYFEVARAGMSFNILATQMPCSLRDSLKDGFPRYIGNILTWVVGRIPDQQDAELVSKMMGKEEAGTGLSVDGTLKSASTTAGGIRGTTDDFGVKFDPRGERKNKITDTDLMELESMQAYVSVTDGQRKRFFKVLTTPNFLILGGNVNPYGPKGLMLEYEQKLAKNPELVLSYKDAMEILADNGGPLVEEPVVRLIQHRFIDMSKSRSDAEIQKDPRLHSLRAARQLVME